VSGILNQRAGIGVASRDGACEWRPQLLIRLDRRQLLYVRFRNGGVGLGLVGILLRDHLFLYQRGGAVGDQLFVVRIGNSRLILLVGLRRLDYSENLIGLDEVSFVDIDRAQISTDFRVQNGSAKRAGFADQPQGIRTLDLASGGNLHHRSGFLFRGKRFGG